MQITKDFEIVVRSEFCLTPDQCYPVKTYLPAWITVALAGMVYLLVKEVLQ